MTNTKNNMPLFLMSGILVIYGLIASTGVLLPAMKYLSTHKAMDMQVTMCLIVGGIGLIGGIVNAIREPKGSNLDRFLLQPLVRPDLARYLRRTPARNRVRALLRAKPRTGRVRVHWRVWRGLTRLRVKSDPDSGRFVASPLATSA